MKALKAIAVISMVNLRGRLEYRVDFALGIFLGILWQSSILVFATVLLTRFPRLDGWTRGAILLMVAMRLLSHGLYVMCFMNVSMVPYIIQEGRIDGYLLRPMPVFRQVMLSRFQINAFGDLSVACTIFAISVPQVDITWTVAKGGYIAAAVLGGMLMEAAVQTAISSFSLRGATTSVWMHWVDDLMAAFGNYPLSIFAWPLRAVLTFGVPLAFIAYLPAAAVTGNTTGAGLPPLVAALAPAIGLGAFVAARLLWRRNLNRYVGIGG
jgi:ABC-2 type transport system permease protein